MVKPSNRHISAMLTDKDVIAYLDTLPNQSEFIRQCVIGVVRGDYVPKAANLNPLAEAKLRGVEIDNKIKQMKLDRFPELLDLQTKKLRTDIELKMSQTKLTQYHIDKLTSPTKEGYRYLIPSLACDSMDFICPCCYKTIYRITSMKLPDYVAGKQQLIRHVADEHGFNGFQFDRLTDHWFDFFECAFYGKKIHAIARLKEMCEGIPEGPPALPGGEAQ